MALLATCFTMVVEPSGLAGDWPTWQYDTQRSAVTPEELPRGLQLQWVLHLPPPRPAWPENQPALQFDASYAPAVHNGRLFVPSMVADHVTAYDLARGSKLWRFYCDGPVRFAPLAHDGRVYFVSDDGHLYCLRADTGEFLWKVRGGPDDRRLLGNERLISMWPARGAPVLYDGTVYFAAGIWPFMGIFLHAVDARTGEIIWTNSGHGSEYLVQQHGSPAFAGVAPQGYLTATEKHLLVSGGRTVPAVFDRQTGKFLYYRVGDRTFGKNTGGFGVTAHQDWYFNGGVMFALADGVPLAQVGQVLASGGTLVQLDKKNLVAACLPPKVSRSVTLDKKGVPAIKTNVHFTPAWTCELEEPLDRLWMQCGSQLLATRGRQIVAIQPPASSRDKARILWRLEAPGTIWQMLAAGGKLLVVTTDGRICAYGAEEIGEGRTSDTASDRGVLHWFADREEPLTAASLSGKLEQIWQASGATGGYGAILAARGDAEAAAELTLELIQRTPMHVVLLCCDAGAVKPLRERFASEGVLGRRVAVHEAVPNLPLPPYFAELVICTKLQGLLDFSPPLAADGSRREAGAMALARRYEHLRPYGGTLAIATSDQEQCEIERAVTALPGVRVSRCAGYTLVQRMGALPGAGQWTHHNGDVANSLISTETNVRAPMGLLWFGGPSNEKILPRHGHGPTPAVVGGRLFIEGPHILRAADVFTGRLLWERSLPNIGAYYDNTAHQPGANAVGSNYLALNDGVYVADGNRCLRLDPASGATLAVLQLPPDGSGDAPHFGYLGVLGDILLAGSSPQNTLAVNKTTIKDSLYQRHAEGSRRLVALDRHTGRVLWTRDARFDFRHNAICAGSVALAPGGASREMVFCIDGMTPARLQQLARRGEAPKGLARLLALDARTGDVIWQTTENVFGTWLAYSPQHHVLLQAGSASIDRAKDEATKGMTAYRAATGEVLWRHDRAYLGPPLLHPAAIVTQGEAFSWEDGTPRKRIDPITGQQLPWKFTRNYGCNTAIGCVNLLTFRSAAAGYFDLADDGGTGNFGGFRAGCTSNLIPADGVLSAPDYTRTCTCAYQQQTSLALVHMPDAEMWTFNAWSWNGERVRRVGINFGAPGDRRTEEGTLWLEYPSVGGSSPYVPVRVTGKVNFYRHHASRIVSGPLPWVACSGIAGAREIRITLVDQQLKADSTAPVWDPTGGEPPSPEAVESRSEREASEQAQQPPAALAARKYTVRLVFAELDASAAGKRRLTITLSGGTAPAGSPTASLHRLENFDIAAAAGGLNRSVVKEFHGMMLAHELVIMLSATGGETVLSGVELVEE